MYHDLPDPTGRAGYLLWQTAHLFERELTAALDPFDLTRAQFGALTHAGREPGVSAAELARRLLLTPQSVQTALTPLIERGLLVRQPHPVHRRVLGIFLTDVGWDTAGEASEAVETTDARLLVGFDPREAEQFREFIRRALLGINPAALDRTSIRAPRAAAQNGHEAR